jgi:long-chain acyl-CoA synthetase
VDPLHDTTLGDVLAELARSSPGREATVDGGRRRTYAALDDRVDRCAAALSADGVGSGERVLWLAQNSDRLLELVLACARLGAMCCPANWRGSADELAFAIDDLSPRVVVWQGEEIGETVEAARARAASARDAAWWQHDGVSAEGYDARVDAATPLDALPAVDPSSALLLLYTAAFEGRPAAAMLSHRALLTQAMQWSMVASVGDDYVFLNTGPMFHIANWWWTLCTFVRGGTNVFTPRVDAETLCRLIHTERCTGAHILGPTIEEIVDLNADGRFDLSSLRTSAVRGRWHDMTGRDDSDWGKRPGGYGQTELVGMLAFTSFGGDAIGLHGRTSPWMQLRILDPSGAEVPAGETGEIVARGPMVMNGYWNRPEENAHRTRDGWHHTNDLGRREADGSITFIGPATRMIKSAAENIYPVEVERCLREHAAVRDCAVIGVPDDRWVQSVKAIVVLEEGSAATEDDLVEHCRARIASYKKPRTVTFVDALPRNGFAVDYDALDAQFGGGGYPGGTTRSA